MGKVDKLPLFHSNKVKIYHRIKIKALPIMRKKLKAKLNSVVGFRNLPRAFSSEVKAVKNRTISRSLILTERLTRIRHL